MNLVMKTVAGQRLGTVLLFCLSSCPVFAGLGKGSRQSSCDSALLGVEPTSTSCSSMGDVIIELTRDGLDDPC